MAAGRRLLAFAPAWMWLFWLAGALVVAAGLTRGGEPEPRFLVTTGLTIEIWHGAERERTLLTYSDGSAITHVAVSEDGSKLAFIRLVPVTQDERGVVDFGSDLYVGNIDGTDLHLVVKHASLSEIIESPVWLTSGRQIAYSIVSPHPEAGTVDQGVETVDVLTGARKRLVAGAEWPALMAGGRELIFTSTQARPETGQQTPLLYDLQDGSVKDLPGYQKKLIFINSYQPSPDGRLIAFAAAEPALEDLPVSTPLRGQSAGFKTHPIFQDIWLMEPDGRNLRRIADLGLATPSLAWSDDSEWVYVMSRQGFIRINAQNGAQETIGQGNSAGRIRLLANTAHTEVLR